MTLLRTASVVRRVLERVVAPEGLSLAQYNALRIIRGAGRAGIPSLLIRDRMIEEGTTITRILDALERAGSIRRERHGSDRRVVLCSATARGAALLDRLQADVDAADEEAVAGLDARELREFIRLLDAVRDANSARGEPRHRARRPATP